MQVVFKHHRLHSCTLHYELACLVGHTLCVYLNKCSYFKHLLNALTVTNDICGYYYINISYIEAVKT